MRGGGAGSVDAVLSELVHGVQSGAIDPVDLVEDGLYFHTVNEQMPIASLTRNAVLFADVLQRLIQADRAPQR